MHAQCGVYIMYRFDECVIYIAVYSCICLYFWHTIYNHVCMCFIQLCTYIYDFVLDIYIAIDICMQALYAWSTIYKSHSLYNYVYICIYIHAVVIDDFTHDLMPEVTFGPCSPCTGNALIRNVTINLVEDMDLEFNHTISVDVMSVDPPGVMTPDSPLSVTILDDGVYEYMHA